MTWAVFAHDKSRFYIQVGAGACFTFLETPFPICQPLSHYRGMILAGISTSSNTNQGETSWKMFEKQFNFLTGNCNALESFICVCFAIIHRDQSLCLRPRCQHKTSMTSSIHTASSPHISHALSRHIPQQREMPRVIIHQAEPFMAHQKTMNCQSERSVCNMKWQRILQTQIKQRWKWESYIMFG